LNFHDSARKVITATAILVAVAFGARTAFTLLAPLVPLLVTGVVVGAVFLFVLGRR
jgi:hypothetical protein